MTIDKSLKQYYDVPGTKKIKGQLHKLAYITPKEAKALKKMGGIETRTPEGILAYPGHHGSSGSSAGVSQGRDAPQRDHHPPVHTPVTTAKAPPSILSRETKPAHLGDTGGSLPTPAPDKGPDHLSHNAPIEYITKKPKIDTGDAREKYISQQYMKPLDIYGDADLEGQKEIDDIRAKRELQSNPNLSKDRRKALEIGLGLRDPKQGFFDTGSGIGKILKGVGMALLPGLLPAKLAAGLTTYNQAKMISSAAKKFGITEKDVVASWQKNLLNKDILKQTLKDDVPKVADRHPGTSKKKKTTPREDRDGPNQILPENLQSAVSEGTQQFLSAEMKEQYKVAQNKMKAALAEGYYTDQDGKQVSLDEEQINALTQWISKIDGMLVDPVTMADGGRIDKALGGRSRDI